MHIIHSNNPDDALFQLLTKLPEIGIEQPSRNGTVLRAQSWIQHLSLSWHGVLSPAPSLPPMA